MTSLRSVLSVLASTGRANRLTPPSQCQRSTRLRHDRRKVPEGSSQSKLRSVFAVVAQHLSRSSRAGGADRDRTDDLKLAKHALSQLSYGPGSVMSRALVGLGRVERPTSRLSGVRSNHLSYEPDRRWRPFDVTTHRADRAAVDGKGRETKAAARAPIV